jgi:hypothetical protein
MKSNSFLLPLCVAVLVGTGWPAVVRAVEVQVRIENLSPANGTFLTPFWVGFHNGGFDLYDSGVAASPALERLAEDGDTGPLSTAFLASGAGTVDGTIATTAAPPPFAPGEVATMNFTLDAGSPMSRYLGYASMIIPSNDAFIANGNPLAHEIFDAGGNFLGADFVVLGSMALDAGTEVNDELPANTAFFGQAAPDTGVAQNGVVAAHPGLLPVGSGGILADPMFAGADFTAQGYQLARITVTQVPEPPSGLLVLVAAVAFAWRRRWFLGARR